MRVAIDATPLVGERTGVGVFTAGTLGALAGRQDVDMVAFALSWRGRHALDGVVPPGVDTCRLPMAAGPLQRVWERADGPVIEWWTGRVDVVHGTNFVVPPAHRAAEVVTVHDLTAVRFPELCQPKTLRFPGLIRRALRRGATVHTVSRTVADEVVRLLGAPPERVRPVPCGIGPADHVEAVARDGRLDRVDDVDRLGASAAAPSPNQGSGRPYVLAVGKAEPRKDLPTLVRAFDKLASTHPDLDLVIAGPSGWGEDQLTASIDEAHHRDRIRRLGWVRDAKKARLLQGAAVFAYPSIYEGFGLPPLEAMAAGVPVVVTAGGALPEVVGDAAKIVPVGDAEALADALAGVLDDDVERTRMTEAGRRRAAQFTWERYATGLYDVYRDAMAMKAQ